MKKDYHVDKVYLSGLEEILEYGIERSDRTGVGTKSVFGMQKHYDLSNSFPLLTTKKVYTRGVFGELLFFLQGRTDNKWLKDRKVNIWNEWEGQDESGDLGPIYGYQWRHFGAEYVPQSERDNLKNRFTGGVDQIRTLLQNLKNDPYSRRHVVSSWNPTQIDEMALPPCHTLFHFYVTPDANGAPYGLSCQLYQRSGDQFLGVPFNIASYAALTILIADLLKLKPQTFVHTLGDSHIYLNHIDQVNLQLSRKNDLREMPKLIINHPVPIDEIEINDPALFENYRIEDFIIEGYNPHPTIKAAVAV